MLYLIIVLIAVLLVITIAVTITLARMQQVLEKTAETLSKIAENLERHNKHNTESEEIEEDWGMGCGESKCPFPGCEGGPDWCNAEDNGDCPGCGKAEEGDWSEEGQHDD
jgi:hypothetical protein